MKIERNVFVGRDEIKTPFSYVRLTNAIPIVFHFRDYTIPEGAEARVYSQKPSGKAVYGTGTIEGNSVSVDITNQMFAELGRTYLQVQLISGEKELVTFAQPVDVKPNYTQGDAPESQNEDGFFGEIKESIGQLSKDIKELEESGIGGSGGQPIVVKKATAITDTTAIYLYMGEGETVNSVEYVYGYVYTYDKDTSTWINSGLYGKGKDGEDGYSPTVTTEETDTGVSITVTDKEGSKTVEVKNGTATDEQVETFVKAWLDENPEATTTVQEGSVTKAHLHSEVAQSIESTETKVFGGAKDLPCVIEEGMENCKISGQYVFVCPKDNIVSTAVLRNGETASTSFDFDSMTYIANSSGWQMLIPLTDDLLDKVLYCERIVFNKVGTESNNTLSVIESTNNSGYISASTTFANNINWTNYVAEIDLSQYTFTEGHYHWLVIASANFSTQGNVVGMYIGLTNPTNMVAGEYTGDASDLEGYILYATEGTTAYQNSLEENILEELEPVFEMESKVAELEENISGDYKTLPCVITSAIEDYKIGGKYVFACPEDNLLDGAVSKGNCFNSNTMTYITNGGGSHIFVPLTEDLLNQTIYVTRKALLRVGLESYTTLSVGEVKTLTKDTNSLTNEFSSGIVVVNTVAEIDLSQYTFTDGYIPCLVFSNGNYSAQGNIVGMYVGLTNPINMICGEYFGDAKGLIGFKVYGTEGTEVYRQGLGESVTTDMPSRKSTLIVNRSAQLEKMEKPFSFVNRNQYLDNGENSYFCWNHNKLHYDKTIHRFIYICKNKSTHTSGDGNVYMYKINPSSPTEATPEKIYVGENQITWLQGFAILEDGTWLLADCSVENYDAPQMIVSRDNGSTFEILCEFVPPIDGGYFNSISVGFNGRIFGAYDDGTVSTTSSSSHIAYSDDNGQTWNDIEITSQKFVEQLILPISDTRLALLGRYNAYGSSEQKSVTAYSDDNGLTWTFFTSSIKQHCNDCAGFVHNGLIELFALERYYSNSFKVGDKMGQLTHYIGSADDFVNDNMIEYEVHYLSAYESADLGHPSACIDEYGNALVVTSANHGRVKNCTYPLIFYSDNNRNAK